MLCPGRVEENTLPVALFGGVCGGGKGGYCLTDSCFKGGNLLFQNLWERGKRRLSKGMHQWIPAVRATIPHEHQQYKSHPSTAQSRLDCLVICKAKFSRILSHIKIRQSKESALGGCNRLYISSVSMKCPRFCIPDCYNYYPGKQSTEPKMCDLQVTSIPTLIYIT